MVSSKDNELEERLPVLKKEENGNDIYDQTLKLSISISKIRYVTFCCSLFVMSAFISALI